MSRKIIIALCYSVGVLLIHTGSAIAQTDSALTSTELAEPSSAPELDETLPVLANSAPTFIRGEIQEILDTQSSEEGGYQEWSQTLLVRLITGEEIKAEYQLPLGAGKDRLLSNKQQVIIAAFGEGENSYYMVNDLYRFPAVLLVLLAFLAVILVLGGWRGVTALGGLAVSIWLLLIFVVPQIAGGANPLLISTIATVIIAVISLLVAHGWNGRSVVALLSTLMTLGLALIAAVSFVSLAQLFGLGSEEGIELQYGGLTQLNLRGLLLAGMLIGALGVLDDITTAQTAAIQELHRANPKLTVLDLYQRGMSIGREHITSLVNTLALAYAGVSLPMLLVFQLYQQPLWVTLNSEFVVEEIVRTVVGSMALAVAVPITTWLAAKWFVEWFPKSMPTEPHQHYH